MRSLKNYFILFRELSAFALGFDRPSNRKLKRLFANTDKVIIKIQGIGFNDEITEEVVFTLTEKQQIERFFPLMEIRKPFMPFCCMCIGSHLIVLESKGEIKTTLGLHHGVSIRYEPWHSDAMLKHPNQLLGFLEAEGMSNQSQYWFV